MATLTFLGAARTVTGSKYLLAADGRHILVDCGQFQGLKELRLRNWAAFPIHPAALDAVLQQAGGQLVVHPRCRLGHAATVTRGRGAEGAVLPWADLPTAEPTTSPPSPGNPAAVHG